MTSIILEGPIADAREREVRLLHDIAEQAGGFGEDGQRDRDRLRKNADDLRNMFFLVVVVGEFNAGKSSFINALLGDEMLAMGITPTTEAIELIRYGKEKSKTPRSREEGLLREWTHPNTGGPGVVIVDTPGTGSVFARHEKIAREFLSRSDLVIFLLSAKRAFAQTEKLYLELARNFGKKIILIINQVDLLEKKERREVQAFVRQQVEELLNLKPEIFMVSAKQALKGGNKSGGLFSSSSGDESGMDAVKKHLENTFKKVPPAKQKLYAQLDFASSMLKKYTAATEKRLDLVSNDERQAKQLQGELQKQATTLNEQLSISMKELDRVFAELRLRGRKFITDHLSFNRSIRVRVMNREEVRQRFDDEVVGSALQQVGDISEDYVNAVVDSSRRYWRSIIERLSKLEALLKEQVASPDAGNYANQRVALQEAIAIADSELRTYTEHNLAETLRDTFATNMFGFSAGVTGALLGVLAVYVGAAATGSITATVTGVIGAIVVGPALLLGGGTVAILYWRKLRGQAYDELDTRLENLRSKYRQSLEELTDRERTRLLQYGQDILSPVLSHLEVVAETYREQQKKLKELNEVMQTLRKDIDDIQIVME